MSFYGFCHQRGLTRTYNTNFYKTCSKYLKKKKNNIINHRVLCQNTYTTASLFHKGYYFTGDGARRDADGHYHITGRVDDVINVKGVRLGTAEVEDVMVGCV